MNDSSLLGMRSGDPMQDQLKPGTPGAAPGVNNLDQLIRAIVTLIASRQMPPMPQFMQPRMPGPIQPRPFNVNAP